ncbi:usherin, partial [Sigmodon hispidus]
LEQFIGRMQDFRLYNVSLTNREILELFSGALPHLHIQPHCRCPGSHPRVHPLVQQYCIPNGADDRPYHQVSRLNPDAHPLSFINDNNIDTSWISHMFANFTQLKQGMIISIDLENGQYQRAFTFKYEVSVFWLLSNMFHLTTYDNNNGHFHPQVFRIIIHFSSPRPAAIRIQRKKTVSSPWQDWQYFARNCSIWEMKNNRDLENSDSVNCLQFPDFTSFSHGIVIFDLLTPGQEQHPGYSDVSNSSLLEEFLKATQVRLHFHGQDYPAERSVDLRHRYYAVDEIIISGR